ncbi:MAG: tRNA dihydrouridine synthase DusB [Raoultibacter sp.]
MYDFFAQHPLLLAPMAGVSDEAFRSLCKEQGATLTYTEMVSSMGLSHANEKTCQLLRMAPNEAQVAVQIFGHDPRTMARQASWIEQEMGDRVAYFDINMGCPARKIVSKGDGCALMDAPDVAREIIAAVVDAVELPVTVKFRRGFYAGVETAPEFALKAQEAGAAAVAVHGRFAEQLYRGRADWGVIARVKQAVSIPVIGNGDVRCGTDALALREYTGCDAVMIGRAAEGNPWVFAAAAAALAGRPEPVSPTYEQRITGARHHAALLAAREDRSIIRMRKHAMWYLAGIPGAAAARSRINGCVSLSDFNQVFDAVSEHLSRSSNSATGVESIPVAHTDPDERA